MDLDWKYGLSCASLLECEVDCLLVKYVGLPSRPGKLLKIDWLLIIVRA